MSVVLGVSGGATKTVVLVAGLDGGILAHATGGGADLYRMPSPEHAVRTVEETVISALYKTGVPQDKVAAATFSLSGVEWPEDYAYWRMAVQRRGFGEELHIVHETMGMLRGASLDGRGVVVTAGDSTSVGARAADGQHWNSGHWQESLGTQTLAESTLQAVYRAEVGIEPATRLRARVLEHFRLPTVEDVLHLATARGQKKRLEVLPLARVLLDEAAHGDAIALKLLESHGNDLGDYALAAARRVGMLWTAFPLFLHGSLFTHPSALLNQNVLRRISEIAPDVKLAQPRFETAVGAVMLALEAARVPLDPKVIERLAGSVPHRALFAN